MPLKMDEIKDHPRNVMFWEFRNNKNATETAKIFPCVHDQGVGTDCYVRNCFSQLPSGVTSWRDVHRPGNLSDLDQDPLRELLESNPPKSTREKAVYLNTLSSPGIRWAVWYSCQWNQWQIRGRKVPRFGCATLRWASCNLCPLFIALDLAV